MDSLNKTPGNHPPPGEADPDSYGRDAAVGYTEAALRDFEREIEELARRRGFHMEQRAPRVGRTAAEATGTYNRNKDTSGEAGRDHSKDSTAPNAVNEETLNNDGDFNKKRGSFNLSEYFRSEQEEKTRSGILGRHVGLLFEDLSVVRETYVNPVAPNALMSTLNMVNPVAILGFVFRPLLRRFFPSNKDTYVLKDLTGLVKDGEMCLVLGRSGSGCTTFLRTVSLIHSNIKRVEGKLELAGIGMREFIKRFRSEVLYNPDKDGHIAVLTVGQTLDFALRFRTPGRRVVGLSKSEFRKRVLDLLLKIFKIQRLKDCIVGNEILRGISGGERRRLTIAEMLSTGNAFSCWDNLTNGLDSSTAYEVVNSLRILTDIANVTTVVALCQASEQIYSKFDKLMILDHGLMIYFGPASKACSYFESLGYMRSPTESSPDFLMNIVDLNTRKFNPTFDVRSIPVDAPNLQRAFLNSYLFKKLKEEMAEYRAQSSLVAKKDEFIRAVLDSKSRYVSKRSTFTVSYLRQVLVLAHRNLTADRQNKIDLILAISILIVCSILIGIGFFQVPVSAGGLFVRGSLLLLSVLFNAFQHFADMIEIYQNRFLVERHKNYRFYCASSEKLAYFVSALPKSIVKLFLYTVIVYPMSGLKLGGFLAPLSFFITLILTSMSALSIFMFIASSCKSFAFASRVASVVIFLMVLLSGFPVPSRLVPAALRWVFTINPMKCGFANLMIMEFTYLTGIRCSDENFIPNGPGYDDERYKFCSIPGGTSGITSVDGMEYAKRVYGIEKAEYWINILILVFSVAIFLSLTCLATEIISFDGSSSSVILYKKPGKKEDMLNRLLKKKRENAIRNLLKSQGLPQSHEELGAPNDELQSESPRYIELSGDASGQGYSPKSDANLRVEDDTTWSTNPRASDSDGGGDTSRILAWRNIFYTVNVNGKDVVLTNNVSGYAMPGKITALMGASGAGKTTFLDVICGRKTIGTSSGIIMLGGQRLTSKDHDRYAYCEQHDVLNDTSTVREALRFSAYLRQSFHVAKTEMNQYVEELLSLLELEPLADAIIGNSMIGVGIGPDKRKLVSLGIELASKPSMAILLDEPTTGLDVKSAEEIVRLLKKLACTGLAIICTIHQPNTTIFEQFDSALVMMSGGRTAYFGEIGKHSATILEYFQKRGAVYGSMMNPPEFVIDVIEPGTKVEGGRIDWAKEWIESENNKKVLSYLEQVLGPATEQQIFHDSPLPEQVGGNQERKKRGHHPGGHTRGRKGGPSSTKVPVPWTEQLRINTMRELLSLWRTPDYTTTRVFNHTVSGILNFIAFSNADNTPVGMQTRMFAMFQLMAFIPLVVPPAQIRFFKARIVYSREESVGTYSRSVFALSLILSEIPLGVFCASLYALIFYLPSGFKRDADHTIFFLFTANLAEFFAISMGMAISSIAPSPYLASKFIPLIFLVLHLYSGISLPYSTLPAIVKYTLYWINPFRWMMAALMESEFPNVVVRCSAPEFARFDPPSGMTCGEYLRPYIDRVGTGYLQNPSDTQGCNFCSMGSGDEFLKSWGGLDASYRARDIIIFFIFIITNTAIIVLGTKYIRFGRR